MRLLDRGRVGDDHGPLGELLAERDRGDRGGVGAPAPGRAASCPRSPSPRSRSRAGRPGPLEMRVAAHGQQHHDDRKARGPREAAAAALAAVRPLPERPLNLAQTATRRRTGNGRTVSPDGMTDTFTSPISGVIDELWERRADLTPGGRRRAGRHRGRRRPDRRRRGPRRPRRSRDRRGRRRRARQAGDPAELQGARHGPLAGRGLPLPRPAFRSRPASTAYASCPARSPAGAPTWRPAWC